MPQRQHLKQEIAALTQCSGNRVEQRWDHRFHDAPAWTWIRIQSSTFTADELLVRTSLQKEVSVNNNS
jgi:hypothetical protein